MKIIDADSLMQNIRKMTDFDAECEVDRPLDVLKKYLTLEPEIEMIPLTAEQPSEIGNYLVQVASTDGTATIDFFDVDHYNGDGTWTHYTVGDTKKVSKNIVAWMTLPKKYVKEN